MPQQIGALLCIIIRRSAQITSRIKNQAMERGLEQFDLLK